MNGLRHLYGTPCSLQGAGAPCGHGFRGALAALVITFKILSMALSGAARRCPGESCPVLGFLEAWTQLLGAVETGAEGKGGIRGSEGLCEDTLSWTLPRAQGLDLAQHCCILPGQG